MPRFLTVLFVTTLMVILPCAGFTQSSVTLDHVDGLSAAGGILPGQTITFHLRLTNNSGAYATGTTNGFTVCSPDGVQWGSTVGLSTGMITSDMFEQFIINPYSDDGTGCDTIGIGGFRLFKPGIPDGFDEEFATIVIGPIDAQYEGGTICLDSAFYPPNGVWQWSVNGASYLPEWDGPHCFQIEAEPPSYGTTVIVHGLVPFGGFGDNLGNQQTWVLPMADAIIERLGSGRVFRIEYGDLTGSGTPLSQIDPGEQVVCFSWIPESNESVEGFLEGAADVLFAKLVEGAQLGLWNLDQLHFISHSRGAIVASETIQRLGLFTDDLALLDPKIEVDTDIHFTTLDPHPWDFTFGDCVGDFCSARDESVNRGQYFISLLNDYESEAVVTWNNVRYRDNYYQQYCYDSWADILTLSSDPVALADALVLDGLANEDLNSVWGSSTSNLSGLLGVSVPIFNNTHRKVHSWYFGTIGATLPVTDGDGIAIPNNGWYGENNSLRTSIGFNAGRNFGRGSPELDAITVSDDDRLTIFGGDAKLNTRAIFNGDFSLHRNIILDLIKCAVPSIMGFGFLNNVGEGYTVPGWHYQGGAGDLNLIGYGNRRLKLGSGQSRADHNWVYIPSNATHLVLSYQVTNQDYWSPDDVFKVLIDGAVVPPTISMAVEYKLDWHVVPLTGTVFPGSVRRLTLLLDNEPIESAIKIDDVHFILDGEEIPFYLNKGYFTVLPTTRPGYNKQGLLAGLPPVDIRVTDPDGFTIDKDTSYIAGATYDYSVDNESDSGVYITIPIMKEGMYNVEVIPSESADPTDVFSLYGYTQGNLIPIAEEVKVEDIPETGYELCGTCCCVGIRGDVNGDGDDLNIVDLTCLVDFLFGAGCEMPCIEEADVNGNHEGPDIVDMTFIVDWLFGTSPDPVGCL